MLKDVLFAVSLGVVLAVGVAAVIVGNSHGMGI